MNTNNEKARLITEKRRILLRIEKAIHNLLNNPMAKKSMLVYITLHLMLMVLVEVSGIDKGFNLFLSIIMAAGFVYLFSNPIKTTMYENGMIRAGVVNHVGDPPLFLYEREVSNNEIRNNI